MFHAERVDGIVLNLPRYDRPAVAVPFRDARRECRARLEQRRVSRGFDQRTLAQRFGQMVAGNEEFRVAERLNRADAQDDLLSCLLGGVNLAVELSRAAFYAGTPGYARVVTAGPALDVLAIAGLTAVFMIMGVLVFDYRERIR